MTAQPAPDGRVERTWELREPDADAVAALMTALQLDWLTCVLLVNRGITDAEQARLFLSPRLQDMPDPLSMRDMDRAVDRIVKAIRDSETICVWGDYDVDGVTSATQLLWFFRHIGVDARYFVPDRFVDGYGLSGERMRELAESGVELFITVDCGISNWREVEVAREAGADVVIVDHHQVPERIPDAAAVLDPHRSDCDYPDKRLAACGVTWVLLIALRQKLRSEGFFEGRSEPDLRYWLDLTAIGTVADLVPLVGLNRTIVRYGLQRIGQTDRAGVRALCEVSGLEPHRVTAGRIGFQLGPRINAAGRVAHASAGVELLTTDDANEALKTAKMVDAFNSERRGLQESIFQMACELAERDGHPSERRSVVLAHPEWHPGVLGIVASKLVDRYHRPTILMTIDEGVAKGSARSIGGFKLVEHLHELADMLDKYGGHDHAAGLTLQETRLPEFVAAFEAQARAALQERHLTPRLAIDAEVPVSAVPHGVLDAIKRLEPYGMGNPEPSLLARGARVIEARRVGQDKSHLKMTLEEGGVFLDAIAFGMGHMEPPPGSLVDVVYRPEINLFNNRAILQMRVKAMRPAE